MQSQSPRFGEEQLSASSWLDELEQARRAQQRLLTLYGDVGESRLYAILSAPGQRRVLALPVSAAMTFPDMAGIFPSAARMQRSLRDLTGLQAVGDDVDHRPWLRHGWPDSYAPLRDTQILPPPWQDLPYEFVRVHGRGVHEIAVGPIHAGTIEPGHFHFSVVGEKVLRLEAHLGYKHKGLLQMAQQRSWAQLPALLARFCGDSTVAVSWAYAQAVEQLAGCSLSMSHELWRALLLERERIANHLGDLGALAQDAGWALGMTWFSSLREQFLRQQKQYFGHRLMMDCIYPGGVKLLAPTQALAAMAQACRALAVDVHKLRQLYARHDGLQERFLTTGRISPEQAWRWGATGLVARAAGIDQDSRRDLPWGAYHDSPVQVAVHQGGDVAARVELRFDEVLESLRLIEQEFLPRLQSEEPLPPASTTLLRPLAGHAWGSVEAWRGELCVALHVRDGQLASLHVHDPSWHHWPLLEHAIMDNIVADFPLINKSFNLAYAGCDL